jgi:hypothetical protein
MLVAILAFTGINRTAAHAAANDQEFNIQVSPSPLTVTLTPGQQQTATIEIRNFSNHTETLRPTLGGFSIDKLSKKIELDKPIPANLSEWVHFSVGALTIEPGTSKRLGITYDTPANVGFSYATVVNLSRADAKTPSVSGANLKATVAVFNLININRADAKRLLQIDDFTASRGTYEFLPAKLSLTVKNNGNIIDQPSGSIFIQRDFNDSKPIATIPVNPSNGYVLPGTSRIIESQWQSGFPAYVSETVNGKTSDAHLSWNWRKLSDFRFGRYVAKAVLVYNDGQRDVPLITSITFWVIPWRILGVGIVVLAILIAGLFGWGKLIAKGTKKVRKYAAHK